MTDTQTPGRPLWYRPKLGIRRCCTWAGHDWAAWNMGGDRWLLECDGRDVRLALMDWPGIVRMVTTWAAPTPAPRAARRSIVDVPIEDVPW